MGSATLQLSALAILMYEPPALLLSASTPGVDSAHEQRRDQAQQTVAAPQHGDRSQQLMDDTDRTRRNLDVGVPCMDTDHGIKESCLLHINRHHHKIDIGVLICDGLVWRRSRSRLPRLVRL